MSSALPSRSARSVCPPCQQLDPLFDPLFDRPAVLLTGCCVLQQQLIIVIMTQRLPRGSCAAAAARRSQIRVARGVAAARHGCRPPGASSIDGAATASVRNGTAARRHRADQMRRSDTRPEQRPEQHRIHRIHPANARILRIQHSVLKIRHPPPP